MRVWGTLVMVLGVVFIVLFALAEFGGGHIGVIPFFVGALLILMGRRLRKSAGGIVQPKPAPEAMEYPGGAPAPAAAPAAAPTSAQNAAPGAQSFTVEMPLTPDVAAVISAQSDRLRRMLLYIVIGCVVLFCGLGIGIGASDAVPGEGRTFAVFLSGIGLIGAGMIYGISWLTSLRPVRRDLRGTTYLRTTGPVQVVPIYNGGTLRLADRSFLMNGRRGMKELSLLGWGRVDYSPHGHVILAAWDRDGRNVYSLPGYNVSSGAHGA
jgi:hypothetical protein